MSESTAESDLEFEYEDYEDSEEEIPNEDDDDDEELQQSPRNRRQPSNTLAQQLADAKAEVQDLNKRLGDSIRTGGERLKAKEAEVLEWMQNVREWQDTELVSERQEGFDEGVRTVEARLLKLIPLEEKVSYMEEQRLKPVERPASPRRKETQQPKQSSDATEAINDLVAQFVAEGVPLDQIEQTSAAAVVQSATKYLRSKTDESKGREREQNGATRVSSGASGVTRPNRSGDERRLEELEKQLKQLKGRGAMDRAAPLLAEKREIQQRLARTRRR